MNTPNHATDAQINALTELEHDEPRRTLSDDADHDHSEELAAPPEPVTISGNSSTDVDNCVALQLADIRGFLASTLALSDNAEHYIGLCIRAAFYDGRCSFYQEMEGELTRLRNRVSELELEALRRCGG